MISLSIRKVFPIVSLAIICLYLGGCAHLASSEKDKEKANIFLQLASDQFAQKEYNKAIESTLEALKFNPKLWAAYNHLGIIFMETKRYQKAEENFKKAITMQPNFSEAENNYGVFLNRMDRYSEAIPHFEKALQNEAYMTPENALTNLGYAYFKLGKNAKAKAYHQKALDIIPEFCLANKNMGDIYAKEKNFKMAANYFEKSTTTCPLYEESQYKLGLVLMKLGKKSVAKNKFEQLIQKHKSGPYVDRSQEVLKYLQ
jgi:type IV pilus assembly protein PilF